MANNVDITNLVLSMGSTDLHDRLVLKNLLELFTLVDLININLIYMKI